MNAEKNNTTRRSGQPKNRESKSRNEEEPEDERRVDVRVLKLGVALKQEVEG